MKKPCPDGGKENAVEEKQPQGLTPEQKERLYAQKFKRASDRLDELEAKQGAAVAG